jgi:hypothetical protein
VSYEVHLRPPPYPDKCRPSCCRHEPQFVMQYDVHVVRTKGKNHIEIDHSVCLACGLARPCTVGGNILVDLIMLWERFGFHAQIGGRVIHLRNKWSRIATYLFDENGWNGKRERIARLIDPHLTMRLFLEPINHPAAIAAGHKMGRITVDPSYLREVAA